MSSDLYRIRIDKIVGGKVTCHILIVHPDVEEIPETATFVMNIILECWKWMAEGSFSNEPIGPYWHYYPIDKEYAKEMATTSPYGAIFDSLYALSFGVRVNITKDEHDQIQKTYSYKGKRVLGYGKDQDGYNAFLEGDFGAFEKECTEFIRSVRLSGKKNFPWPKDKAPIMDAEKQHFLDEKVPQADLEFEVTDPRFISILAIGACWGTTIYR